MSTTTYTTFETHLFDSTEFRNDILQIITEETIPTDTFDNVHQFGGWNEKVHRNIDWSVLRSGKNNSMYGRKRTGTYSKETLQKMSDSMKGKNTCRVQIHGVVYSSVGEAIKAHPNVPVKKRIDSEEYPDWIRLDKKRISPRK